MYFPIFPQNRRNAYSLKNVLPRPKVYPWMQIDSKQRSFCPESGLLETTVALSATMTKKKIRGRQEVYTEPRQWFKRCSVLLGCLAAVFLALYLPDFGPIIFFLICEPCRGMKFFVNLSTRSLRIYTSSISTKCILSYPLVHSWFTTTDVEILLYRSIDLF